MPNRLDIDAHVLAYLGFDEANETDVAIDESSYGRDFTVSNSPAAAPARVNNGRQFNGASTVATPPSSAPFRQGGDLSILCWIILDQVNTSGSLLRTIIECAGASAAQADNCLYGLYVSNAGELVYRHEYGAGQQVLLKTAPGSIKTGRYYSVAVTRQEVDASTCEVKLFLDNTLVAWTTTSVVTKPDGGSASALKIGKSDKNADGAYWLGMLDELSIHDAARPFSPYLRSAYFRLTLYSLFFRLTIFNNVKSVGGTEMGGGQRWWVYERDSSLYAIRENTLGLFSAEVQLTSGGLQPNGTLAPGGTEKPTLLYDKTNDVLLVAFISSGRVFKLTAGVGDAPITQPMPYTVDTAGIVKVRDSNEGVRLGLGAGAKEMSATYVTRQPIKMNAGESVSVGLGVSDNPDPWHKGFRGNAQEGATYTAPSTIAFSNWSSFGIIFPFSNTYGYAVYSYRFGAETYLGTVIGAQTDSLGRLLGFWPIPARVFGTWYYLKPLGPDGKARQVFSNWILDMLGSADFAYYLDSPTSLTYNRHGDDPQLIPVGLGSGEKAMYPTYVNRSPIKLPFVEPSVSVGEGAGLRMSVLCNTTATAKQRKSLEVS